VTGRKGQTGGGGMPNNPFTAQGAFEPDATAAMGEAFDAACKELHCTRPFEMVREFIAALILAAAKQGEFDPGRLQMAALVGFAMVRRDQPARASNTARAASSSVLTSVRPSTLDRHIVFQASDS
jgi:hypothetical protein